MRTHLLFALLLAVTALSGCSFLNPAPSMTADQLAAAAKDKNASVGCGSVVGPGDKGTVVFVNVDKSSINSGSVTVDSDCKVTITATKDAK